MGLFSGKRPKGLGVHEGRLQACSWKPNCVNSMADASADPGHSIAPLAFGAKAETAWADLAALVKGQERVNVVKEESGYLYAEFRSRGMGYVDDVEFLLDASAGVIHIRSASRLGIRDFGVNRARIEALRRRFAMA